MNPTEHAAHKQAEAALKQADATAALAKATTQQAYAAVYAAVYASETPKVSVDKFEARRRAVDAVINFRHEFG